MDRLDRILHLVRHHRPALKLVHKRDVRWMRAMGLALRPLVPDFDTGFTTVVGDTVYLPRPVAQIERDTLAVILAHELVHQLDQAEHGLRFYATYAVAPLPFGRTRRAFWERRAYAVDLMIALERGGPGGVAALADQLADVFAGRSYGWMWAGRDAARAFLQPITDEVCSGALQQREPYRSILAAWRGPPPAA